MKVFAMLMLRFAFVMLLSSLLRNGTKATLDELNKLENWKKSCQEWAVSIAQQKPLTWHHPINIKMIMKSLTDLLDKVKKFPIEGMEEPLSRRLKKPLGIAIGNCEKILDEVEQFGQEGNKKYLDMLSSKINSIRKGIDKEFNTFIMEVELALIEKKDSFRRVVKWISEHESPRSENEVRDFQSLIFDAKLKILEKELSEKIAEFEEQKPNIDVDGFVEFSDEFINKWEQIEQKIDTANIADKKIEKTLRERTKKASNEVMDVKIEAEK
uniref:Uncharacterized protein n=1 Tax=Globodera rostochiensis TaxID=31243 RepID=A0A914HJJ2_GLORO